MYKPPEICINDKSTSTILSSSAYSATVKQYSLYENVNIETGLTKGGAPFKICRDFVGTTHSSLRTNSDKIYSARELDPLALVPLPL